MIETSREKDGKTSTDSRFYLSDLVASSQEFNQYVRNHWSIENRLHWTLDVVLEKIYQEQNWKCTRKYGNNSEVCLTNTQPNGRKRKHKKQKKKSRLGRMSTSKISSKSLPKFKCV